MAPMETKTLWPHGVKIEVLGVTGELYSGKTLFVCSIAPKETLIWDLEKSSSSYEQMGIERRDVAKELLEKYPGGYKPVQLFTWWVEECKKLPVGKYKVIGVDPINDIEAGLVQWVRANPGYFGYSSEQFSRMEGVMWGCVAQYWKNLINDLASRCECFAFTTHMGDVWSGSSPVKGKRKPKGKGVLQELASLYLHLERRPVEGVMPPKPIGYLDRPYCKNRVARFVIENDDVQIIDVLPPRIPDCTPAKIRWYIENPIGLGTISKSEMAFEPVMSDDDKLRLKLETAEAERDIEQIKLDRLEKLEGMAMAGLVEGKATEEQLKQVLELRDKVLPKLGANEKEQVEGWRKALEKRGAASASDLTKEAAKELIDKMKEMV